VRPTRSESTRSEQLRPTTGEPRKPTSTATRPGARVLVALAGAVLFLMAVLPLLT
jgi:hypothetical protein